MSPTHRTPKRNESALVHLLEKLTLANGISGDEGEVRAVVLEQARKVTANRDDAGVRVDVLGNVLVTLTGKNPEPRPRVMIAAHIDEVGLMITADEGKGIFRFEVVGGIDPRQLVGKPVLIGKSHVPGVIGAKPIHLTKGDELKTPLSLETLRIDIGPGGSGVKVGERAAFASGFVRLGAAVRAKALDNRLGVTALLELIKGSYPHIDLLAAFTTQEEVGGRGAMTAAYNFDPHMAVALDSTPAYDLPVVEQDDDPTAENRFYNTRLGGGPAIYTADAGTLSDPRLIRWLAETAEQHQIPFQLRQPGGGGTDAGAIHRQRAGIPSVSLSVPSRYQHTAISIGRISDLQDTIALLDAALQRVTPQLFSGERM